MTPQELAAVKTAAKTIILEIVVTRALKLCARTSPDLAAYLEGLESHLQASVSQLRFPNTSPEMSDLMASVFQDALDDFLKQLN